MTHYYSPFTGELLPQQTPWALSTDLPLPVYDPAVSSLFVHDGQIEVRFSEPPEPPLTCTRRQGRLALLSAGKLEQVESYLSSIEDPVKRMTAQVEYEADTWERNNPLLQQLWEMLGGTEAELDSLFILAVTL